MVKLNKFMINISCRDHKLILGEKFIVGVVYLSLSVFISRSILLMEGTIGHHIDWSIPSEPYQFYQMINGAFYNWNSNFLGWYRVSTIDTPFELIFGYLGLLSSGEIISKAFILFTMTAMGFSMYYLSKELLNSRHESASYGHSDCTLKEGLPAFMAGLFYMLSPVIFNHLCDGHIYVLTSYAISPFVFLAYLRSANEGSVRFKYVFLTAIGYTIATFQLQFGVMLFLLFIFYIPFSKGRLVRTRALFEILILTLLLQSYWLLNFLVNPNQSMSYVGLSNPSSLANVEFMAISPIKALTLTGYFLPWYEKSLSPLLSFWWYVAAFSLVVMILSTVFFKRKSKTVIFSMLVTTVCFSFIVRGAPLQFVASWLLKNVPVMLLFREPHHLMFIPSFGYAILVGVIFDWLAKRSSRKTIFSFLFLFLILFSIYVQPMLTGDFGGNVWTYTESSEYGKIEGFLSMTNDDYRVIYLPMTETPTYLSKYDQFGGGSDPMLYYSPHPTLGTDVPRWDFSREFSIQLEQELYANNVNIDKILALATVKYIILRSDVRPQFNSYAINFWAEEGAYRKMFNMLQTQKNIRLIKDFGNVSLWENVGFLPHIYATNNVIYINGTHELLPYLLDFDDFTPQSAIFFSETTPPQQANFILNQSRETLTLYTLESQDLVLSIIDQSQNSSTYNDYISINQSIGQTFVVGNVARIKSIMIMAESRLISDDLPAPVKPDAPLVVTLYDDPSKTHKIASYTILPDFAPTQDRWSWVTADLDVNVVPNTRYYVEFTTNSTTVGWAIARVSNGDYGISDHYINGTEYVNGTPVERDLMFETYGTNYLQNYLVTARDSMHAVAANVTFQKLNPTKYIAHVEAEGPFFLVFSESYHSSWAAYVDGKQIGQHFLVNGYANAWYINKTGSYTITLEFLPQKLYTIGSLVSIMTLILCVLLISKNKIKTIYKRYIKKNNRQ